MQNALARTHLAVKVTTERTHCTFSSLFCCMSFASLLALFVQTTVNELIGLLLARWQGQLDELALEELLADGTLLFANETKLTATNVMRRKSVPCIEQLCVNPAHLTGLVCFAQLHDREMMTCAMNDGHRFCMMRGKAMPVHGAHRNDDGDEAPESDSAEAGEDEQLDSYVPLKRKLVKVSDDVDTSITGQLIHWKVLTFSQVHSALHS
jgi:hypothetical protein